MRRAVKRAFSRFWFFVPMAEDLLQRICFVDYGDYGSLRVDAVECLDRNLHIDIAVTIDEDIDLPKKIRITGESYLESNVAPAHYVTLETAEDHVLLWHYKQPFLLNVCHDF
jgi:hypothetical protein